MNAGRRAELWTVLLVVALDQATKAIVRTRFDLFDSVTVIPGWFNLTRVHNTGTAFGMLNGVDFPGKAAALSLLAAAALVGLAWYAATLPADQWLTRWGLSGIVGGAAGNLIDRVTAGYVVDFVDVYRGGWHFWAFNVADAAISIGVALMVLDILGVTRPRAARAA